MHSNCQNKNTEINQQKVSLDSDPRKNETKKLCLYDCHLPSNGTSEN